MIFGLEWQLIAELLLLGSATGFLAGLLGIGGGMLLVPFLTMILAHRGVPADLAVKMAIATSMSTILFTSLSSVRAHHRRGAVRWDLVRGLAPGIVIGGLLAGAGVFALLKGAWLAIFFALFVGFSATQMLRGQEAFAEPADACGGGPAGRRQRDRFPVGAGRRRRRLRVGALHDLVQRRDPQRGGDERGAGLPDRAGQHGGLRDRRLVAASRAAGRAGLPVPAGAGRRSPRSACCSRRWARARRMR